jgi:polyisoprenoid-binding protein YceI
MSAATATAVASEATTRSFRIDQAHSEVTFRVRHLLTRVRGRFSDFEGSVAFDISRPEASSVTLTIQAASIDTNQADRDQHLRSADFFDVDVFPTLTFVSTDVTADGADRYRVSGALTIHGVSRSVELLVVFLGVARDAWGHERLAFEAETTINRKDYGLTWNAALETGGFLVGDEVTISVAVQAVAE